SRGYCPATPRMPSVPKSSGLVAMFKIIVAQYRGLRRGWLPGQLQVDLAHPPLDLDLKGNRRLAVLVVHVCIALLMEVASVDRPQPSLRDHMDAHVPGQPDRRPSHAAVDLSGEILLPIPRQV